MKPLWLEAVDVGKEPPEPVETLCTDGKPRWAVSGLLDRLAIDPSCSGDHAAADPGGAPDFAWWWHQYFRCPAGQAAQAEKSVWPHPPRELCIEPGAVLKSLVWLRKALDEPGVLKQQQVWAWLRFSDPYDESTFAQPFRDAVDSWIAFCERAVRHGHRIVLRMDN